MGSQWARIRRRPLRSLTRPIARTANMTEMRSPSPPVKSRITACCLGSARSPGMSSGMLAGKGGNVQKGGWRTRVPSQTGQASAPPKKSSREVSRGCEYSLKGDLLLQDAVDRRRILVDDVGADAAESGIGHT